MKSLWGIQLPRLWNRPVVTRRVDTSCTAIHFNNHPQSSTIISFQPMSTPNNLRRKTSASWKGMSIYEHTHVLKPHIIHNIDSMTNLLEVCWWNLVSTCLNYINHGLVMRWLAFLAVCHCNKYAACSCRSISGNDLRYFPEKAPSPCGGLQLVKWNLRRQHIHNFNQERVISISNNQTTSRNHKPTSILCMTNP